MPLSLSARVWVGSVIWLGLAGATLGLLAQPHVRAPLVRTVGALLGAGLGTDGRQVVFQVGDARGIDPGCPVFAQGEVPAPPVGYVVSVEGSTLRVVLAEGSEAGPGLTCLPPSRTWAEAVDLALPPALAAELSAGLEARLARLSEDLLLPGLEARLPAFLARLDPRADPATRGLLDALGTAMLGRLTPLLEGLTQEVSRAVGARLDLLDRLGLLWKVVRGDGEGLRRQMLPLARDAAERWWAGHAREVVAAVGAGLEEHRADVRAWVEGPGWQAVRDELLLPVLREGRERLATDAQALLSDALGRVALAPGGGFRPRFASVLRTHLLGRGQALLLVEAGAQR